MSWAERLAELDARLARQGERIVEAMEMEAGDEEARRHGWKVERHRAGRRVPFQHRPPAWEEQRRRQW